MFLQFLLSLLGILSYDGLDFLLVRPEVLVSVTTPGFQLRNVWRDRILLLFGHQGLAHTISNWALVQCLVRLDGHFDLISHSDQQEAPLSTVDRNLSDQLIEALGEKLLTEGADAGFAGLTVLNLSIKLLLQVENVDGCGGLGRNVTHEQTTALGVLPGWQDRVQVVLITLLLVLSRLIHLTEWCLLLAFCLFVSDWSRDELRVVILHERVVRLLGHITFFKYY